MPLYTCYTSHPQKTFNCHDMIVIPRPIESLEPIVAVTIIGKNKHVALDLPTEAFMIMHGGLPEKSMKYDNQSFVDHVNLVIKEENEKRKKGDFTRYPVNTLDILTSSELRDYFPKYFQPSIGQELPTIEYFWEQIEEHKIGAWPSWQISIMPPHVVSCYKGVGFQSIKKVDFEHDACWYTFSSEANDAEIEKQHLLSFHNSLMYAELTGGLAPVSFLARKAFNNSVPRDLSVLVDLWSNGPGPRVRALALATERFSNDWIQHEAKRVDRILRLKNDAWWNLGFLTPLSVTDICNLDHVKETITTNFYSVACSKGRAW